MTLTAPSAGPFFLRLDPFVALLGEDARPVVWWIRLAIETRTRAGQQGLTGRLPALRNRLMGWLSAQPVEAIHGAGAHARVRQALVAALQEMSPEEDITGVWFEEWRVDGLDDLGSSAQERNEGASVTQSEQS